jgi:peptide/nickel transport system permease protein
MVNLTPGSIIAVLVGDVGFTQEEAEIIERELGFDKPLPERYVGWLGDIIQGDLGQSIKNGRDVKDIIWAALPSTLQLGFMAILMASLVGIPFGVWSAVRQDRVDDYVVRLIAIAGISVPSFWIALVVLTLPAIWWGWTPPLFYSSFRDDPWNNLAIMFTPAAILALQMAGQLMRITRSSVLEVIREDYVRTAQAKGLNGTLIMRRHILPNAMLPVLTLMGNFVASLVTGALTLEKLFNLPGVGTTMVTALSNRDFPVITGLTLVLAIAVVLVNLVVDVMYRALDPRIKY